MPDWSVQSGHASGFTGCLPSEDKERSNCQT